MRRWRNISRGSLFGVDEQTRRWMSLTRTPATRSRIRFWSRWEVVSFWIMIGGGISALALPLFGIGFGVRAALAEDPALFWWFAVPFSVTMVLFIAGSALGSHAKDRRLTAMYADGHSSVGRLDEVITYPGGGDDHTTYDFQVSAELPGPVILRRTLRWGEEDGLPPERWIGRPLHFRHNTMDPDDLHDVRFDGWAD